MTKLPAAGGPKNPLPRSAASPTGNPVMIHGCRADTAIHGTHAFVLQDAGNRRQRQGQSRERHGDAAPVPYRRCRPISEMTELLDAAAERRGGPGTGLSRS